MHGQAFFLGLVTQIPSVKACDSNDQVLELWSNRNANFLGWSSCFKWSFNTEDRLCSRWFGQEAFQRQPDHIEEMRLPLFAQMPPDDCEHGIHHLGTLLERYTALRGDIGEQRLL